MTRTASTVQTIAIVLRLAAFAAALAAIWLLARRPVEQPAPASAAATEPDAAAPAAPAAITASSWARVDRGIRTDRPSPVPLHVRSRYAPGTRIAVRGLPPVDHGIPTPDGTVLPALNGMTEAPPFDRDPRHGPTPPVVALWVDHDGFEWWIHADGSATTCRYQQVVLADGRSYWDPVSLHATPADERR